MKKLVFIITLFTFSFIVLSLLFAQNSFAQTTCDLCGKCDNGALPVNYNNCVSCLYPTPGVLREGYSWTVIGCVPTTPSGFVQKILVFTTSIFGGIAFLLFLFGGFKILTSSSDPVKLSSGKSLVFSSLIALFLIIFAVFLLKFIGFEVLRIPGFQ